MAIRMTTDQIIKTAIAVLLAAWAALLLTGCKTDVPVVIDAPVVVEAPVDVTGVDLSKNATTTTAGDNATITNVSLGGSGVMALMLGLLAWRHRTAVGALDRVVGAINRRHRQFAKTGSQHVSEGALKLLKDEIAIEGCAVDASGEYVSGSSDRIEHCIRSRLARIEKK